MLRKDKGNHFRKFYKYEFNPRTFQTRVMLGVEYKPAYNGMNTKGPEHFASFQTGFS